ncbi:MAG TPA: hypothetical protein VN914_14905 [Polyangia bacterium]|nr:hypothetical protein [Polyangia bacterium]
MIVLGTAVAPKLARAELAPAALDHHNQGGVSLMPGLGYRVIVPYSDNKTCGDSSGDAGKRVCTNMVPIFLDLQLSFGVSRRIDLITDLRFGLGKDPASNTHQFALAPGVRFWLDQDVALKFYTTVQLLYDNTDYHGVLASNDFGLRNSNGLMYDVIRNVGFFFQFGESFGFRRWFRIELDAGVGIQVRFP